MVPMGCCKICSSPYFYRHSPWASNRNRRLGKHLPTGGSYGLFPFHIDLYFKEVPAVIPQSKIRDFCQLPLAREPLECAPKPPWPLWGWFGEAKPGGFRRQTGFHIGLCFRKVLAVESLSHASGVPAPFSKGACGQCPRTFSHRAGL